MTLNNTLAEPKSNKPQTQTSQYCQSVSIIIIRQTTVPAWQQLLIILVLPGRNINWVTHFFYCLENRGSFMFLIAIDFNDTKNMNIISWFQCISSPRNPPMPRIFISSGLMKLTMGLVYQKCPTGNERSSLWVIFLQNFWILLVIFKQTRNGGSDEGNNNIASKYGTTLPWKPLYSVRSLHHGIAFIWVRLLLTGFSTVWLTSEAWSHP